jgi:hypothetical protein
VNHEDTKDTKNSGRMEREFMEIGDEFTGMDRMNRIRV